MATEQLLTTEEVAGVLRVHPATVTRMANEGVIRALKVGIQWRFYPEAVDEYLQGAEHKPLSQAEEFEEATRRG